MMEIITNISQKLNALRPRNAFKVEGIANAEAEIILGDGPAKRGREEKTLIFPDPVAPGNGPTFKARVAT